MTDIHAEHVSALTIIRHSRVMAQARVDQFMLLLRALSKELEDWKWKEQEAEAILSLAQKTDPLTIAA